MLSQQKERKKKNISGKQGASDIGQNMLSGGYDAFDQGGGDPKQ